MAWFLGIDHLLLVLQEIRERSNKLGSLIHFP